MLAHPITAIRRYTTARMVDVICLPSECDLL
jgi:hypothetical protein